MPEVCYRWAKGELQVRWSQVNGGIRSSWHNKTIKGAKFLQKSSPSRGGHWPQCFLQSDETVLGDRVTLWPEENGDLFQEIGAGRKTSRNQPHQLPASLVTQSGKQTSLLASGEGCYTPPSAGGIKLISGSGYDLKDSVHFVRTLIKLRTLK